MVRRIIKRKINIYVGKQSIIPDLVEIMRDPLLGKGYLCKIAQCKEARNKWKRTSWEQFLEQVKLFIQKSGLDANNDLKSTLTIWVQFYVIMQCLVDAPEGMLLEALQCV